MSKKIEYPKIGTIFGRLKVVGPPIFKKRSDGRNRSFIPCKCSCGNIVEVSLSNLKSNNSTSCGCLHKELVSANFKKHGGGGTRLYNIWKGMRGRCNNSNAHNYKWYGGKGIYVDQCWDNFIAFKNWAIQNGYQDRLEIDRINSDGPYSPENCRWVTKLANIKNRDRLWDQKLDSKLITYAKENNLSPYDVIQRALYAFLDVEEVKSKNVISN